MTAVALDATLVRRHLRDFAFRDLFVELGWNRYTARPIAVTVGQETYTLHPVAEKRGVQVFVCDPDARGDIPAHQARRRIERAVTEYAFEHLIVFADAARTRQIWQWVAREPGQAARYREHTYTADQSGEALIQKLQRIVFTLEDGEDEGLTITATTVRLRDAFDKDRVTKRFYDRFKAEHGAFLKFVEGIC